MKKCEKCKLKKEVKCCPTCKNLNSDCVCILVCGEDCKDYIPLINEAEEKLELLLKHGEPENLEDLISLYLYQFKCEFNETRIKNMINAIRKDCIELGIIKSDKNEYQKQ